LYHRQETAEAALEQADTHRSTVITCVPKCCRHTARVAGGCTPLKAATAAETAAHKSLEITHKRLLLEEVNYVALLNAEQTYLQSTLARVQAQANRYVDTAELYQALGGGWWNRRILRKLFKMQMHPTRYETSKAARVLAKINPHDTDVHRSVPFTLKPIAIPTDPGGEGGPSHNQIRGRSGTPNPIRLNLITLLADLIGDFDHAADPASHHN
jgi:hypothetical protein